MKKIISIRKGVFKKNAVTKFGRTLVIENKKNIISKLLTDLTTIRDNFGNTDIRMIFLEHVDSVPPKTKRCEAALLMLDEQNIKAEKIYFENFDSDDMRVLSAFEVSLLGINNAIRRVNEILSIYDGVIANGEIKKKMFTDESDLNIVMNTQSRELLKSTSWGKTELMDFIHEIQNYYKRVGLYTTEISVDGEDDILISFYTPRSFDAFVKSNDLKATDYKKIDTSTSTFVIVNRKIIKNTDAIISYSDDMVISNPEISISSANQQFEIVNEESTNVVVGVLDSAVSSKSIIRSMIKYTSLISPEKRDTDFHGEAVTSTLLFGGNIHNNFNDNCLRPKVHHFEIFYPGIKISELIINIRNAISQNKGIKIWNLSINSVYELAADAGIVSLFASELDIIQKEYDVIIIQSAGNKNKYNTSNKLVSPSDSIRSLVVTSSNGFNVHAEANYSLEGYSKFLTRKPDVAHFGGTEVLKHYCYYDGVIVGMMGTSFASPLVARKMAHIIATKGYSTLVAKALIIHTAFYNSKETASNSNIGWGLLPVNVEQITETQDDEIRMIISNEVSDTKTYFGDIKLFKDEGKFYSYSTFATVTTDARLDSKFGAEYIRATIKPTLGVAISSENENEKGTIIDHRKLTPLEDGEKMEKEKKLIEVFGKWKSVQCYSAVIKSKPKESIFDRFQIELKIDKRMTEITKGATISLSNVIILTFKHKDSIDNFYEFVMLNRNLIENINQIEEQVTLTGEIQLK